MSEQINNNEITVDAAKDAAVTQKTEVKKKNSPVKKAEKPKSEKKTQSVSPFGAKPRKGKSLQRQKGRMGWLFITPFLVGFFLIYLPMIVESIMFSFGKIEIQGGGGYILEFVGLENYSWALFEDTEFLKILFSSIQSLIFNIPAIVVFSLFMAVLLNQKMRGRAIFRAIFFIPVIVSTGIIESIDLQNTLASNMESMSEMAGGGMESATGAATGGQELISAIDIQRFFSNMAIGKELVGYVLGIVNGVYDIVNKSGVQMLIFLAGLQSISPAIYESCHIDGASSWETFWKITFPMISPMILVNAVYTVIDSFTSQSNAVMTKISAVYDAANGTVRATAMSWMYFVLVIAILGLVAAIMGAYVFYQRRDT